MGGGHQGRPPRKILQRKAYSLALKTFRFLSLAKSPNDVEVLSHCQTAVVKWLKKDEMNREKAEVMLAGRKSKDRF